MPSHLLLPDPAADETDRLLAELEKRIHKEYKQAIKEADKKWRDYLSAFDAQDKVEAERLAKGEITKAEYQDWRRRHLAQGKHWEEMRNVMAQDYHNRNLIAAKLANKAMPDVYAVNANYGTYLVEHGEKIDTGFTLYNHDSAESLLKKEWSINPETGRNSFLPPPKQGGKRARELAGLRTTNPDLLWNAKNIQSAMMQGVLSGESMTSLAQRLAGVAEMDEHQAIRNARTLTTNVQSLGRYQAADRATKLGVKMVDEWNAILDGRTRHSHRHMHGERKDHTEDSKFSNGLTRPGDPNGDPAEVYNCRCRLMIWPKGHEGATVKKNPAMGDMSFDEWQNAKAPKAIEENEEPVIAYQYHATKRTSLIGIAEKGLKSNRGHVGNGVYFADSAEDALEWTRETSTGGTTVLRVKESFLKKGPFEKWAASESDYGLAESLFNGIIPLDEIEIKVNDNGDDNDWWSLAQYLKNSKRMYDQLNKKTQKVVDKIVHEEYLREQEAKRQRDILMSKSKKSRDMGLTSSKHHGNMNTHRSASTKINKSGNVVNPMPKEEYDRIKSALERNGKSIRAVLPTDTDDAFEYMTSFGIEASYLDGEIRHLGAVPSRGTLYEEIIHIAQERKYGLLSPSDEAEMCAREVEAARKLLKHRESYRLDKYDVSALEENLSYWERRFKREMGVSYDESHYRG